VAGVAVSVAVPEAPVWVLTVAVAGVKVSAAGGGGGGGAGLAPPPPPPQELKRSAPVHKIEANRIPVPIPLLFTLDSPCHYFLVRKGTRVPLPKFQGDERGLLREHT
jgi:hypothetical protein